MTENPALENLERSDISRSMRAAVHKLNPKQRQVIELTYFQGLTQNEAAQRLNQPLGTVKARIRRGIMKLRSSTEKI